MRLHATGPIVQNNFLHPYLLDYGMAIGIATAASPAAFPLAAAGPYPDHISPLMLDAPPRQPPCLQRRLNHSQSHPYAHQRLYGYRAQ